MARARVIKKQDRCFVELPKEFLSTDEIELFPLRDGYYLLSQPLPGERAPKPGTPGREGPSPGEIAVLHKLQSIKFGERTPENVAGLLDDGEKESLRRLEERGWVNVFKGSKYRNGVYNIADEVYPMLKGHETGRKAQDAEQKPKPAATPAVATPSYSLLRSQGYLIIKDQKDAKALSEMLKSDMKEGSVIGIKGFDGAFYVVTRDYLLRASKAVLGALKEEADVQTIAESCSLDADGVRAVLHQLAESGEVIEKRRDRYAAV